MDKIFMKKNIPFLLFTLVIAIFAILSIFNIKSKNVYLYDRNIQANQPIGGLYYGEKLQQEIQSSSKNLKGFGIRFGTYGRENHSLVRVTFLINDEEKYQWEFGAETIKDGAYTVVLFPETIKNNKNDKYLLQIECSSPDGNNSITVYSTLDEGTIEESIKTKELSDGTLGIKVVDGSINAKIIIICVAALSVVLFVIGFICAINETWSLQKKYLILAFAISFVYLLLLPYGIGPDEEHHFLRIFEISEGHILSDHLENGSGGRTMASNLKSGELDTVFGISTYWNKEIDRKNETTYYFGNTALYSPVSYSIQTVAVCIAKLFTNRLVVLTYIAKIAGLIFSLFMVYMAIKYVPIKKECIFSIALIPMFIHQSVVISADGFLNAIALFFVAYILYLSYAYEGVLTKLQIVTLYVLPCVIGLTKIVYLPICLLLFMIPKERFKSKKEHIAIVGSIFILTCIVNLIWLSISSGYLFEIRQGVNGAEQVKGILKNPFKYIIVIYNTIVNQFGMVFWQFFGDGLGRLSIPINRIFYFGCAGIMLILAVNNFDIKIKIKDRVLVALASVGCFLLICTSEYVQWTKVAATEIDGIQGRYFIPIAFMIMLSMSSSKLKVQKEGTQKYLLMFLTGMNVFVIISCIGYMLQVQ